MSIYRSPKLDESDFAVITLINNLRERLTYFVQRNPIRWTGILRRNTQARNIQGSNSIEGYHATIDDVNAIIAREQPFESSAETIKAIQGYQRAMTYILALADGGDFAVTTELIKALHFMMLETEPNKLPGKFRRGPIYVARDPSGETVYEGAESFDVAKLIAELVESLNRQSNEPTIVRAAMAHLNLTMIHPFKDGNGRMARALQTLALARDGTLSPEFSSIEEWLGRNTQAYYNMLAETGQGAWHPDRSAHGWVKFCLLAHYQQARSIERRNDYFGRVWTEVEAMVKTHRLNGRIETTLMDAALGYRVTAGQYRAETEISDVVASRDLRNLCDLGLLTPHGEKRGRYYRGSDSLRELANRLRRPRSTDDPYDLVRHAKAAADEPQLPL